MHYHHKYIFYPILLLLSSCELALVTHPLTQRSFEHFSCLPNCILPFVYFNPVQLLCAAWISTWVMLFQIAHCRHDNDNDMSWRVIMVLFRTPSFTRLCSGYFSGIPDEMQFSVKTPLFHYQCIIKATGRTEHWRRHFITHETNVHCNVDAWLKCADQPVDTSKHANPNMTFTEGLKCPQSLQWTFGSFWLWEYYTAFLQISQCERTYALKISSIYYRSMEFGTQFMFVNC